MSVAAIGRNACQVQAERKTKQTTEDISQKDTTIRRKPDAFVRSHEETDTVYSPEAIKAHKLSGEALEMLKDERVTAFRTMLQNMLLQQGERITGDAVRVHMFGKDFAVTPEDSARAAAEISEDGYWGVDAVATRILDMAKALSGGDASRFAVLKDAVLQGFAEAQKVWGGEEMPDITSETYDEVMKRFDEWEKELGLAAENEE